MAAVADRSPDFVQEVGGGEESILLPLGRWRTFHFMQNNQVESGKLP